MRVVCLLVVFAWSVGCSCLGCAQEPARPPIDRVPAVLRPLPKSAPREVPLILKSAAEQTTVTKAYDPAYVKLAYPNGDVPLDRGVCSDVVIRAFRNAGVDLQKEVHEDMAANFAAYPKKWGLKKPDSNIDHRRVLNLQTYFKRRGKSQAITQTAADYQPGDIVAWDLNGKGLMHVGIVSNLWSEQSQRYLIMHNIGNGAEAADVLFGWKIVGHYRCF